MINEDYTLTTSERNEGCFLTPFLVFLVHYNQVQGCKFSVFCLISENCTSKYLKMFFEISSL